MSTILAHFFDDLDSEFASTRRLLERFPEAHAEWQPHAKSMSLVRLAVHVAELPNFAERILTTDEMDFATHPFTPNPARTVPELLAVHDRTTASARAALERTPMAALDGEWTLRAGPQVYLKDRRGKLLRQHLVSHIAHHRGQLTVYYRMLGVAVPGLYGPSADEM